MTFAAAVVLPSAPLLLPGVSARLPVATAAVRAAIDEALAALPPHDLRILLAGAAEPDAAGVYVRDRVDLGGLSRPELSVALGTPGELAAALGDAAGLAPLGHDVPVDLAVLALHAARAGHVPSVAIAVPWSAGDALPALGARLGAVLPAGLRAVVVAAGDLSAGLGATSPRPAADGGQAWNDAVLGALGDGDAATLAGLGPERAAAAAARGWPALTVLLGLLAGAGARLSVRCADAPRGIGYVVAGT